MAEKAKTFPLRLECMDEVGAWASRHGMSINAALNHMAREFLDREMGEVSRLQAENEDLRQKIISIVMASRPDIISK